MEIYHPENEEDHGEEVPRLLLMISKSGIYPDNELAKPLARDIVYVEKSVAETYKLPNFKDVIVTQIDTKGITLDSIELTFKEQYMGRSDMWRLAKSLNNTGNLNFRTYSTQHVDIFQTLEVTFPNFSAIFFNFLFKMYFETSKILKNPYPKGFEIFFDT